VFAMSVFPLWLEAYLKCDSSLSSLTYLIYICFSFINLESCCTSDSFKNILNYFSLDGDGIMNGQCGGKIGVLS